ncbi:PREDICTED: uncharacterized protein LOC109224269 [Nicotiana attenuata]|uniref:uncharacterized protein LOC109224269 n=1 Tax=Nicotiana attenuata TaxID=49451 RepID=UPI0009051228|nr:PREDICTED: uncharacterized protein LOC109224269 [Nicotiana attenuata]
MQRNQMQYQKSGNHKFGNGNQRGTTQRSTTLNGRKAKFNPNVTCSHCKKVGHTVSYCYMIIYFSEDFEFTRGNQTQTRSNGAFQVEGKEPDGTNNNEALNQHLSHDQFTQLVQLIKQVKGGDSSNSGNNINANAVAGTIARCSGTCLSIFNTNTWIIDAGASQHMFCLQLHSILFFTFSHCKMQGPLVKKAQVFGKARDGLYLLEPSGIKPSTSVEPISVLNRDVFNQLTVSFPVSASSVSDASFWHIRAVWNFLMSTKSNAFGLLKNFLIMVERQFGVRVQKIRSDNAFELGKGTQEAAFLASQGILHQTSCVATPQQNGVVERKHRHLLEIARALLFQPKLSNIYWGEYVLTATYLINRLPSRVLKGKTPYFVLFKQEPSYDFLKCFGCLCYASTLVAGGSKFDPRAKPCVFLGYPLGQKGYKVLELDTRRVRVSRDVYFYENLYPFASTTKPINSFFPVTTHLDQSAEYSSEHTEVEPGIPNSPSPSVPTFSNPSNSSHFPSTTATSPTLSSRSSTVSHVPISLPEVRKSTRPHNPPSYLQDYVCNSVFLTDLTTSCFTPPIQPTVLPFTTLFSTNQSMLNSTSYLTEPSSYSQASLHPGWQ